MGGDAGGDPDGGVDAHDGGGGGETCAVDGNCVLGDDDRGDVADELDRFGMDCVGADGPEKDDETGVESVMSRAARL